jgi:hypothetical protein
MVAQNHAPPQEGNAGHSHHWDAPSSVFEVYMFNMVNFTTRANTYDTPPGDEGKGKVVDQPSHPLLFHLPILFILRRKFLTQRCARQERNLKSDKSVI